MHPEFFPIRADLFNPDAVAPEVTAFNVRMSELLKDAPGLWDMGLEAGRSGGFMPILPPSPRAFDRDLGQVSVHVLPSAQSKGIYLHIHGGGMVLGTAAGQDMMLEGISAALDVTCVSVEYRLAPENPYPAAWDDCEAAASWLVHNAKAEFGTDRILIGGESAGALLAVATLVRLRDRLNYTEIAGANLSFGCFDSSMTPSQLAANTGPLSAREISRCAAAYCSDPAEMRNPEVSPLFADLTAMPPVLLTVGTLDPFLDDSLFMYSRWIAAGNSAELAIWPGAGHGFVGTPHPLAGVAGQRIEGFLAKCLAATNE
jgi:acetyl esterase